MQNYEKNKRTLAISVTYDRGSEGYNLNNGYGVM